MQARTQRALVTRMIRIQVPDVWTSIESISQHLDQNNLKLHASAEKHRTNARQESTLKTCKSAPARKWTHMKTRKRPSTSSANVASQLHDKTLHARGCTTLGTKCSHNLKFLGEPSAKWQAHQERQLRNREPQVSSFGLCSAAQQKE